jgi:E3 ubiquitin-protein ligase HUWE1
VDLHQWIHPLNVIDASFQWILQSYSKNLLLVEPIQDPKRTRRRAYFPMSSAPPATLPEAASTLKDIQALPDTTVVDQLLVLLKFTVALLRNATGKSIYQSVHYLTDLLAAADDSVSDTALEALQALSLPPALHKQQGPEQQVHTTLLHQMLPLEHSRVVATARGWGTKAMGLGLATTVTADDSIHGQGSLRQAAGEVHFCYYQSSSENKEAQQHNDELAHVILTETDILDNNMFVDDSSGDETATSSNKRRKVSNVKKTTKSSAELFFLALERAGGKEKIPADRLYSLLADIRLARSFHSRATRIQAVERRLRSLVAMLHSHPSQEAMTGYFQAQPELCVEIVDLLRPTVGSANVSAASSSKLRQDPISGLVGTASQSIPLSVRMLALEALAALVLRRDGLSGALSGSSRLSSVLMELGVGKGQYLGVLPTLIRYSLACLTQVVASDQKPSEDSETGMSDSFEVGLAFVEATMPPQLPRKVQVEQALEFIDNVLTLTSAIVATPTGTSALVDCGLIPALLTTVSVDPEHVLRSLLPDSDSTPEEVSRIRSLLRFITSQAVQILEGAFVTHSNALSTFHDLNGVEVLMESLSREINATQEDNADQPMDTSMDGADGDAAMADSNGPTVRIRSSQRVVLYAILTCLTVVFHQESTSAATPAGGTQLRKPALTRALIVVLDNVQSFGGHLASLVATMLSDVLNSDPHAVHYVHKSGIAEAFLNMVLGKKTVDAGGKECYEPVIPPIPELIMAIPNVISALSLTEDGAKAVKKANPFPAFLRIFYHPNYAMPKSRCLLNEMTAIVGTGLDEIMRHVERLRPQILSAIAEAMNQVVAYSEDLTRLEEFFGGTHPPDEVESMRTCLIQYVMNFAQLLEQILHNEDHCEPFVEAGGLDALLKIFPSSMPCGLQFVAHVSGMSSPSVGTLHHSTLEESLSVALKCLYQRFDTLKMIRKVIEVANQYLDAFDESKQQLLGSYSGAAVDLFPLEPFLEGKEPVPAEKMSQLSSYLRHASHVQWITNIVATAIKAASQRSQDSGTGWSRAEREWKKEISSDAFEKVVVRLAEFHRSAIFDVCRVRTGEGFEILEKERLTIRSRKLRYKLRIVCPEGAVVRDGIEIDSCANVGSMEMGEVVEAFDRCINSSGILRYRTKRGWVSEMTRGHGREPISEVLSLWEADSDAKSEDENPEDEKDRRIEAGVPDLRTVAVSVLARGQAGYSELFGSLSKLVTQGIRSLPIRTVSFDQGTQGAHIASIINFLATNIRSGLGHPDIVAVVRAPGNGDNSTESAISAAGTAMYLGCLLNHIYVCLFEDRRERRIVNFPLLVYLIASRTTQVLNSATALNMFDSIRYVLDYGLTDFAGRSQVDFQAKKDGEPRQRVSRSVAASYPPLVTLLRKLMSTPLSSSPAASIMSRMKWKDVSILLSSDDIQQKSTDQSASNGFFRPEAFARDMQLTVSEIVKAAWLDPRITHAPPFLVHPIATVVGDVLVCLEEASKKKKSSPEPQGSGTSERILLSDFFRRRENEASNEEPEAEFEASEEAILRLMEMGFTRDHALDALESTRSNRVELAMDYALSHAPPSPEMIERRRVEREERARRRAEQRSAGENGASQANQQDSSAGGAADGNDGNGDISSSQNVDASGATSAAQSAEAMETESPPTGESGAAPKEKSPEDDEITRAKEALASWITDVPIMACNLLAASNRPDYSTEDQVAEVEGKIQKDGDAEGEALTVVLSSFLLDLCHRYPDKRTGIVTGILETLKGKLSQKNDSGMITYEVPSQAEGGVASLCHAAVLFTRALPKTRLLVLEADLVTALVSCLETYLRNAANAQNFPLWVTPTLLLLDTMAQPIVAFSDDTGLSEPSTKQGGDLDLVRQEHNCQVTELAKSADAVFSLVGNEEDQIMSDQNAEALDTDSDKKRKKSLFSVLPAYFPLLPSSLSQSCLNICHKLVVVLPEKNMALPPGLAHAALLLLLRLVRSPKTSAQCLRMGMAEALLKLPKESRFTGNTGLVTLILRRFLEDEATLQAAMETEIRSTLVKLGKKSGSSQSDDSSVPISAFLEAVTPLLCREPESFLKALALCIQVEHKKNNATAPSIKLISGKVRSQRMEALSDILRSSGQEELASPKTDGRRNSEPRQKKSASASKLRSKSPPKNSKRNSLSRKKKRESMDSQKNGAHDSPASHITCLLINAIIALSSDEDTLQNNAEINAFLWAANLLQILADLILAVPACASAVHNYRPNRGKDKQRKGVSLLFSHALKGCPAPPKTFISFILHSLLPQDRWSIRMDRQLWDRRKDDKEESSPVKERKTRAYRVVKVSQTAARVLAALVARPGEGRKRVIADLTFALSGGRLGHSPSNAGCSKYSPSECTSKELCALQAWGELCLGFAAPRSNGRNQEGTTSLSVETVRIMLETGLAHALLYAMNRVNLFHPMASNTCSVLLHPLEVLSRPSVTVAVSEMVKKESSPKEQSTPSSEDISRNANGTELEGIANSTAHDVDVDLEIAGNQSVSEHADYGILLNAEEEEMHEEQDDDDAEMDDVEHDNPSDDEELRSSIGSHDSSESDESGMDEEDEDASEMDDSSSEESDGDDVDEEGDWDVHYDEGFAAGNGDGDQYEYDEVEEEGTERVEQDVDEGWTRVESSGFGGMLLGSRRNALGGGVNGDPGGRARGVIDAAEAMIGSLLREADISSEALAEIEGSLGIRIMSGGRTLRAALSSNDINRGNGGESVAIRVLGGDGRQGSTERRGEVMGTLPHIHQRGRPDVGYSAFGRGGQWGDANAMEYVYGGPSVTSGSRNYDLVSARVNNGDDDLLPSLTQLDLQLFPGGPASAASALTQHSLHPLLCGVDLPPMNSLVSDLLPHGQRAARRGQMATRRPGDWTNANFLPGGYLVSTSNGNIVRSNRTQLGASLFGGFGARNVSGPIGWTDDGLPVDATVQDFSAAFERALGEERTDVQVETRPAPNESQAESDRTTEMVTETEQAEPDDSGEQHTRDGGSNPVGGSSAQPDQEQESVRSDGDRVASSLETGLRLSPGSEQIGNPSETPPAAESASRENAEVAEPEIANAEEHAEGQSGSATEGETFSPPQGNNSEGDEAPDSAPSNQDGASTEANSNGLVCPPEVDPEVFNSLPVEMQRDCVAQYNATQELAAQLDGSSLDPEVLAALPEDMRREVIEQDRRERMRLQNQDETPADPSHAEEMDNASFIASLAPELREEILLTADESFLSSLPPNIVAEAQILRERATTQNRRIFSEGLARSSDQDAENGNNGAEGQRGPPMGRGASEVASVTRRRQRSGKLRVEIDASQVVYLPDTLSSPVCKTDVKTYVRLLFLLAPVRPPRILQKLFQNFCSNPDVRHVLSSAFVSLLHEDEKAVLAAVDGFGQTFKESDKWRRSMDDFFVEESEFPPSILLGAAPDVPDAESFNLSVSATLLRPRYRVGNATSIAANFPSVSHSNTALPSVVASRVIDTIMQLCKNSPRFSLHTLVSLQEDGNSEPGMTSFERLIGLLDKPMYAKSSANLDQLLSLLECAVSPLSHISKHPQEEAEVSQRDIDAAALVGKEWVAVPRVEISQPRLQLLCSILRMETCRDSAFTKVNTIVRRLCRVEANRGYVLSELASVAHGLGVDALRDLKGLKIRMDVSVAQHQKQLEQAADTTESKDESKAGASANASSSITLSTSTSELKLLRVLQTLQALCNDSGDDNGSKKNEGSVLVTEELVHLLRQMEFDGLWDELSSCLTAVQVLEGVKTFEDDGENVNGDMESNDDGSREENGTKAKKLRSSAAGLLTRFLPSVEAFFVANASATRPAGGETESSGPNRQEIKLDDLVGGQRVVEFVAKNKVLLNALVRNNAGLLDKGLRALVQVPRCRVFLDFDVKRQWFKTQVRRLRQQASRRHGHQSLRLHIRRKYVFEDAYHQLRLRNAEEMRGRLHITFRNEEGVDAGGLSREFFAILAKEIFNPNYALFTSTEDGCTFQPNTNSSINPDHLSYFRFVGRIVGKAVVDGFLLDAHFTRSLYKHMLGLKPTHGDMEAIDPDYYRNLKTILDFSLEDIGLDLTFSIEDHSFGRSQVIDLIPNGRKTPVTEENKEEYVRQVCQNRMTTAIQSQIKAYLDGFYELVSPDLIAIFTPRELELLISGMPDIDVEDLKKNTDYVGWKATDTQIEWFWNIIVSLSRNEKAAFLQFVTGSSKVPLNGFSELQGMRGIQKFSIHKANGTKGALASAHTCFNSLDLPVYDSEQEMREKLSYAISEGGGAFLFA